MIPKFRFYCTAGMFDVIVIDFEAETVRLDDGDIRNLEDGTLLQWTGLKDKKKKEIFEGDIVSIIDNDRSRKPYVTAVTWNENNLNWNVWLPQYGSILVIGNIFENPEIIIKRR